MQLEDWRCLTRLLPMVYLASVPERISTTASLTTSVVGLLRRSSCRPIGRAILSSGVSPARSQVTFLGAIQLHSHHGKEEDSIPLDKVSDMAIDSDLIRRIMVVFLDQPSSRFFPEWTNVALCAYLPKSRRVKVPTAENTRSTSPRMVACPRASAFDFVASTKLTVTT